MVARQVIASLRSGCRTLDAYIAKQRALLLESQRQRLQLLEGIRAAERFITAGLEKKGRGPRRQDLRRDAS